MSRRPARREGKDLRRKIARRVAGQEIRQDKPRRRPERVGHKGSQKDLRRRYAGRIMEALKSAGSNNPIILLDEIDKLGVSHAGDPASALLEVLDPEQNKSFRDHYIEIPFDLSKVMFIASANTLDTVPRPLIDRMDVIEVSGYTMKKSLR